MSPVKVLITITAAVIVAVSPARAQQYPAKPVKILVGYGTGGTGDITTRIVAQKLSEVLGQQFVVDNRPSAGGIVASQLGAKASPDGYTLIFIATGNFAMTPSLFKSLPFDPVNDFEAIAQIAYFAFAMVATADSPLHAVKDVIAQAKANPGRLNVGSVAIGSAQYLAAELFKSAAGIEATTVPFKTSGDVISALRANSLQLGFETLAPLVPHVKSGTLKALAVTTRQRFPELPAVPTMIEAGLPGYEVSAWNGLAAPAKTPRAIVDRLNHEINAVIALPDVQQRFLELGVVAKGGTPEQMRDLLISDIAKWKDAIEKAKIEKQ
jgi:tripartite-type tricarboxylate transporter receptor subunit TctC